MFMNGYPIIYRPNHPKSSRDGYIYEHIEVAENKLGRFLKQGEVVHHRDQNRNNNSPDNLLVFISKSDHTSFHHHNCDESLLKFLEDGTCTVNYLKSNICPRCGGKKDRKNNICWKCRKELGAPNRVVDDTILTREKLKELIRTTPFTQIGKEFGVSDNAIRKWCDKYDLPRKKKDINKYTDEEWALI